MELEDDASVPILKVAQHLISFPRLLFSFLLIDFSNPLAHKWDYQLDWLLTILRQLATITPCDRLESIIVSK